MSQRRDTAFDDFVQARGWALLRFAYVLSGDAHLSEDLVQEVLARMHRRWDKVTALQHPEAYVRTAIVRQYVSWRRRRSAGETILAELPEPPGLSEPQQRVLARDQMWRLMAGLPRAQRAVLVLRFYCDLPDDDIAQLLGCGQSTVRSQAARALARMRTLLADEEVHSDG
ncbi:SigE family RNA polymerase sigma factor [Actinoplanes sp. TFC3]|uniref:SigE family RNA polymerase sigma factor n=1 Tax=Actinoplanes sp. TFC3 TaxID=1710355 RepID=UPI000833E4CF|nr:SigE family RNA polymerase sigma factor [Actinoplanes sp. TFC3]